MLPKVLVKFRPRIGVRIVTDWRPSARCVMRIGPTRVDPPTPPEEVLMRNGPKFLELRNIIPMQHIIEHRMP